MKTIAARAHQERREADFDIKNRPHSASASASAAAGAAKLSRWLSRVSGAMEK